MSDIKATLKKDDEVAPIFVYSSLYQILGSNDRTIIKVGNDFVTSDPKDIELLEYQVSVGQASKTEVEAVE